MKPSVNAPTIPSNLIPHSTSTVCHVSSLCPILSYWKWKQNTANSLANATFTDTHITRI